MVWRESRGIQQLNRAFRVMAGKPVRVERSESEEFFEKLEDQLEKQEKAFEHSVKEDESLHKIIEKKLL